MSGSAWFHKAFDAPYLEVYAHRDEAEAQLATRHLLEPLLRPGLLVLDLACGAGRWLPPVAAAGARAIGVDLSWDLLQRAAQLRDEEGVAFDLLRGDMLHVPLRDACCDVVLSLFTSFGYFDARQDDVAVLHEVHRVLRPGGFFLLDVFNATRVRAHLVPQTRRTAGEFEVLESRRIDAARDLVIKDITLERRGETFRYREQVRLWERQALQEALRSCGFVVRRVHGDYSGAAFDVDHSPRLILLAAAAERPRSRLLDSSPGGG